MAQVQIQLQQVGDTATKAEAGNYEIIIDRPPEKGGGGKGPMGGQVLLMGVGGCFASTLYAAAKERNIIVTGLKIKLSSELSDSAPARFSKINIEVTGGEFSEPKSINKLIDIAQKGCISINTIKQGMEVLVENGLG